MGFFKVLAALVVLQPSGTAAAGADGAHRITCTFPKFCAVFEPCTKAQLAVPTVINARIQDGFAIAEFWTPASPEHLPWPATVLESNLGEQSWTLFTAGDLHGAWMMTVFRESGRALLSHHSVPLFTPTDMAAARGTCVFQKDEA